MGRLSWVSLDIASAQPNERSGLPPLPSHLYQIPAKASRRPSWIIRWAPMASRELMSGSQRLARS